MFGPISDLVPSTPIFEMYPLGFIALSEYLERHGLSVRIINIALKMIKNPRLDVERLISGLHPLAFGIDLHWLPHAHGSLEIAKIVKKYHPEIPVIFGGYSATYFHEELIHYPQVDYIVKGDSSEEPMRLLLKSLKQKTRPDSVPNLTWKEANGEIRTSDISFVPDNIDHISLDCAHVMRSVVKYQDLMGHIPFENWLDYPITPVLSCRGCIHNCVTCGGSAYGARTYLNRKEPAYRDPELLANDVWKTQRYLKGPIFIFGDIRQAGLDYADRFLRAIKEKQILNPLVFEFFNPPPKEFYEKLHWAVPRYNVEISPESGDERVRRAFGRPFSNEEMELSMAHALENGCERLDLFFMTGLPHQTAESVRDTAQYCEQLMADFNGSKKLHLFISPLAPFLDPGSLVYEHPEAYGYKVFYKTLEEHRVALTKPSWKYILNYETDCMTRDQHVDAIYDAALTLNRIKEKHEMIDPETAKKTHELIVEARDVLRRIDEITEIADTEVRDRTMESLRSEFEQHSKSAAANKELEWPTAMVSMNLFRILRSLLAKKPATRVQFGYIIGIILKMFFLQGARMLKANLGGKASLF
jgi:B12-binding domain/radical SAM domain protein